MASGRKFYKRLSFITLIIALLIAAVAVPKTLALTERQAKKLDVQAEAEEVWGEAVEGVQVRLRAAKSRWNEGRIVRLWAHVRNQGTRNLLVRTQFNRCELEVDGQWYRRPLRTHEILMKRKPFPPGRQYDNIAVDLDQWWELAASQNAGRPGQAKPERLKLTAGKRTIRVAFTATAAKNASGKPVRAISNPVVIEVISAKEIAARSERLKSQKNAFELRLAYHGPRDNPNQSGVENPIRSLILHTTLIDYDLPHSWSAVSISEEQAARIIDHLQADGSLSDALPFTDERPPPDLDGPAYSLTIKGPEELVLYKPIGWGLSVLDFLERLRTVLDGEPAKVLDQMMAVLGPQRKQWEAVAKWGQAVEGVQVRLRVKQSRPGTGPQFYADVRNLGTRNLLVYRAARFWTSSELEIDGRWYRRALPKHGYRPPLSDLVPGRQFDNIFVDLSRGWYLADSPSRDAGGTGVTESEGRLKLAPGKHTIRVAPTMPVSGNRPGDYVRVISNPVEIEIVAENGEKDDAVDVATTKATLVEWLVSEGGNGHFYEAIAVPGGISWTDASEAANLKGGYLVTITSQAENDFVHDLINDALYWDGPCGPWIGGYQPEGSPEPAGGWRWVTDEPFLYSNWNNQQPNEFHGNNENRIHFGYIARIPFWNDVPDTAVIEDGRRIRGYIVETIPATAVGAGGAEPDDRPHVRPLSEAELDGKEILKKLKSSDAVYEAAFTASGTRLGWPIRKWEFTMLRGRIALEEEVVEIPKPTATTKKSHYGPTQVGRFIAMRSTFYVGPTAQAVYDWVGRIPRYGPLDPWPENSPGPATAGSLKVDDPDAPTYMLHIRRTLWCLGRGYSRHITKIGEVSRQEDGRLKVTADGLDMALRPGAKWELVIDPGAEYMVRSAKLVDNRNRRSSFTNSGLKRYGSHCVPEKGECKGAFISASFEFQSASFDADVEFLRRAKATMQPPYLIHTDVSDQRKTPELMIQYDAGKLSPQGGKPDWDIGFEDPKQPATQWGEPVEGLAVRLRAKGATTAKRVTLLADARNDGPGTYRGTRSTHGCWLKVDGKWYGRVNTRESVAPMLLKPGDRQLAFTQIRLRSEKSHLWRGGFITRYGKVPSLGAREIHQSEPLELSPGRHTVRLAFPASRKAYAYSNPVEIEILPAEEKPAVQVEAEEIEKTDSLVWGKEVNGLRAAVEFVPEKGSYEQGEVVGIRFHLQNVSNQIINLATPRWWIQSRCFAEDQLGIKIPARTVPEPWGMTTIDRHKLLPGRVIKLETGSLAIAKDKTQRNSLCKYPVRNVVTLKPGRYSLYYWLRFPGITRLDGDGKVIVPQPDDWQGALETGKRKLVITSNAESDQKPTVQVEGTEITAEKESEFSAILPNGVTVELIGMCKYPSADKQWWRPDGSLLVNPPYDESNINILSFVEPNTIPIEFAFRLSGNLGEPAWEAKVKGDEQAFVWGTGRRAKDGEFLTDIKSFGMFVKSDQRTLDLRLGFSLADRPYEWVDFKNISVKPNFKPDVQIEAEGEGEKPMLVWGDQVHGLRAAVEFVPEKESYDSEERVGVRFHIQNVSNEDVQFSSMSGRQYWPTVKDSDGKEVKVDTWESLGTWSYLHHIIKPGQILTLKNTGLIFSDFHDSALLDKPKWVGIAAVVRCGPGQYSIYYKLSPTLKTGVRKVTVNERPPVNPRSFELTLDQQSMLQAVQMLRRKYRVRICFEQAGFESGSKQHLLTGTFFAPTIPELLDKLTEKGLYKWEKFYLTYAVYPKQNSLLRFSVKTDISERPLESVARVILDQDPRGEQIEIEAVYKGLMRTRLWISRASAMYALSGATARANISSSDVVWTLTLNRGVPRLYLHRLSQALQTNEQLKAYMPDEKDQLVWGEVVEGLAVRLRAKGATKAKRVTLLADARNDGPDTYRGTCSTHGCWLKVDGKWYWRVNTRERVAPMLLKAGDRQLAFTQIRLGSEKSPLWRGGISTNDGLVPPPLTVTEKRNQSHKPLELTPGRHSVRLALPTNKRDGKTYAYSNTVEIQITPDGQEDQSWGKAVEGIQVRLRPDKRIWNEGDDPSFKVDIRNNGTRELETCLVASIALEMDGKAYAPRTWFQLGIIRVFPFGPGSEYTIKSSCSNFSLNGKGADKLTPGKHTIRVVYLDNRDDSGIHTSLDNYGKMALAFSNPVEIEIVARSDEPAEEAAWGQAVEGVQVRLRAVKSRWNEGAVPRLWANVRNQGVRNLLVRRQFNRCELEVDGQWYRRPLRTHEILMKRKPFPPGRQYDNIAVDLDQWWELAASQNAGRPGQAEPERLKLTAGKHTIRVAFTATAAKNASGKPVRAISNPVVIEILPKEKPAEHVDMKKVWGQAVNDKQDAALQKFIRQYSKQKIVCLDIGEQYTFRSHNGIEKLIRLAPVKDYRDKVVRMVRRAEVVVVNGRTVRLVCQPYTMPTVIDGLRIQADTTSGWRNINKRVQLSIWDANDPIVDTRKFCFPINRYLLFSHGLQAYNEVRHLGLRDGNPGHTAYHDYGIDLGGYDGGEDVVSCCSGRVVSLWPKSGMARSVSVQDEGGLIWLHTHLDSVVSNIVEGVKVSAGQKIGVLGKRGHSGNFSHLHLGTSLTRADLTANRFCRRLNLYPWIVTAFQEKCGCNLYAVARPHQVVLTGEEVIFDGSKSMAYDAKIVDYRWEFDNGNVVHAVKAEKVFDKPGVYVGTLRVRDEQGNEDVDFCRVKVFTRDAPEDNIATIYMTHTPTMRISEGQEVLFQFWIQGGKEERISIDFGDGATLSDYVSYQEVHHKFDRQGIYIITATVNVNGLPIMGKQRVVVESTAGRYLPADSLH